MYKKRLSLAGKALKTHEAIVVRNQIDQAIEAKKTAGESNNVIAEYLMSEYGYNPNHLSPELKRKLYLKPAIPEAEKQQQPDAAQQKEDDLPWEEAEDL